MTFNSSLQPAAAQPTQPRPGQSPHSAPASVAADSLTLRARALTKVFGTGEAEVQALTGVDVDFEAGCFTAIMGPSGSGKSTLLYLLAGLETATSGTVHLGETELTALNDDDLTALRRDRIGFVFQSFNLLPMFTAAENINLPLALARRKPNQAWFDLIVQTLGLTDRLTHRPSEMSGGQQQRAAIGRALITRPDVILADEPTGNLDTRSGLEVLSFLRRSVRELGQTVVMVTHDPTAAAYAQRVVLLADGKVAGDITSPTPEAVVAGLEALRQIEI